METSTSFTCFLLLEMTLFNAVQLKSGLV